MTDNDQERIVGVLLQDVQARQINIGDVTVQHITQLPTPPPRWINVPTLPNHFVGRDQLIDKLVQRLINGQTPALAIHGMPGVGKSTLAVVLAHHPDILAHFIDGVLWAGLGTQPNVLGTLAHWADAFGEDVSDLSDESTRSQAVRNAIGRQSILLVIDDAWDLDAAQWLKCGGPNSCHLLTTRDQEIAQEFAGRTGMETIPVLEKGFPYDLLLEMAPEACLTDPAAAKGLAEAVGGLPLALELMGSFLAKPKYRYFPDLSEEAFRKMADPKLRLELATKRFGAPEAGEVTLKETIALSLEDLPARAEKIFFSLGAFAPKPDQFEPAAALVVTGAEIETLALLISRNLVGIDGNQLTLHKTIADMAREQLDETAFVRHRDYYLDLVNQDREDWQRIEQVYGQIKWAWSTLPEDEAAMLDYISALTVFQDRRGLWQDQLDWIQRGLKVAETKGLRQESGTLLNNIGMIYDNLGQRDKALEYYQHALPIQKEVRNRTGEATTLNNIGMVYHAIGQPDQALEYLKQALPIQKEVQNRAQEATTLTNIGSVYRAIGQPDQALDYFQQALPIQKEVRNRAGEAAAFGNIGMVYRELGQPDQALDYFQQALPIFREVGDRSREATTFNNFGLVYRTIGQPEKALDYYQQALPIFKEVGDRTGSATTLNNIGMVYRELGQPDQALDCFQQALPIQKEVRNRVGESVTRFNIAIILREQGQLAEAVEQLRLVVELDKQVQHPDVVSDQAILTQVEKELAEKETTSKKQTNDKSD